MRNHSLDHVHDFICVPNSFTHEDCRLIIERSGGYQLTPSERYSDPDPTKRKSNELRVPSQDHFWNEVKTKLWKHIVDINYNYFGFDIDGIVEDIRLIEYTAPDSHFSWHMDRDRGLPVRKLSFSLMLDKPSAYRGGVLEFNTGEPQSSDRDLGTLVVFPSFLIHRVTPVTYGIRRAIVGWVSGPAFR